MNHACLIFLTSPPAYKKINLAEVCIAFLFFFSPPGFLPSLITVTGHKNTRDEGIPLRCCAVCCTPVARWSCAGRQSSPRQEPERAVVRVGVLGHVAS